jgi:hypothetical protein
MVIALPVVTAVDAESANVSQATMVPLVEQCRLKVFAQAISMYHHVRVKQRSAHDRQLLTHQAYALLIAVRCQLRKSAQSPAERTSDLRIQRC